MPVADWPNLRMTDSALTNSEENAPAALAPDFGLVLSPITDAAHRLFGIEAQHGVVVLEVNVVSAASINASLPTGRPPVSVAKVRQRCARPGE